METDGVRSFVAAAADELQVPGVSVGILGGGRLVMRVPDPER